MTTKQQEYNQKADQRAERLRKLFPHAFHEEIRWLSNRLVFGEREIAILERLLGSPTTPTDR